MRMGLWQRPPTFPSVRCLARVHKAPLDVSLKFHDGLERRAHRCRVALPPLSRRSRRLRAPRPIAPGSSLSVPRGCRPLQRTPRGPMGQWIFESILPRCSPAGACPRPSNAACSVPMTAPTASQPAATSGSTGVKRYVGAPNGDGGGGASGEEPRPSRRRARTTRRWPPGRRRPCPCASPRRAPPCR